MLSGVLSPPSGFSLLICLKKKKLSKTQKKERKETKISKETEIP